MMSSDRKVGVADMITMSEIDEIGINQNLYIRYISDIIYVSFSNPHFCHDFETYILSIYFWS